MNRTLTRLVILVSVSSFVLAAVALVVVLRSHARLRSAECPAVRCPFVAGGPSGPRQGLDRFGRPGPAPAWSQRRRFLGPSGMPGPGMPKPGMMPPVALGARRRGVRRPSLVRILERLAGELHLDKAQVDQIRRVSIRTRTAIEELDAKIQRARREMRSVLEDTTATETQVCALIDHLNRLQARRSKLVLLAPWRIRALLSPDQLVRLRALTGRPEPRPHTTIRPQGPETQTLSGRSVRHEARARSAEEGEHDVLHQ